MTQTEHSPASLADEALDAFWQVIVKHFPQATSGDLAIDLTMILQLAAETAIKEWIANNVTPEGVDHA